MKSVQVYQSCIRDGPITGLVHERMNLATSCDFGQKRHSFNTRGHFLNYMITMLILEEDDVQSHIDSQHHHSQQHPYMKKKTGNILLMRCKGMW